MRNSNKFNYIFQMPSAKLYEHQINIFSIICARVFVCTFNILQCSLDYTCYFLSLTLLFVQSIKNIFKEFFFSITKKYTKIAILSKICGRSVRGKVGYKNFICILLNSNWAYCVICKFITTQMVRSHSPLHISLARFSSNSIQMKWKKKEYARNYRRRKWFWYWQENCSNCTLNGIVHENSIHIHFDGESSNIAKYVWCIRQEILCSLELFLSLSFFLEYFT